MRQLPNSKAEICIKRFSTPLGAMIACATDQGVCLLEFADRKMLEKEIVDTEKYFDAEILPGESQHLIHLQQELKEYFHGKRKLFSVPLHISGTAFQQKVWEGLKGIPFGGTRSYKQQAAYLNIPTAVRAVASANGKNQVAIIIPCHRVIGTNGDLTGYAGGLYRKSWLLEHERKFSGKLVQGKLGFINT